MVLIAFLKKRNLPFIPSRAPDGGHLFVYVSVSPASQIAAGYWAKIPRFRVKRPKVEPPIFRDRSPLCRLDAGGVFQDGPKTQNRPKWPSRLDGALILKHKCFYEFSAIRGDLRSPGTLSSLK